MGVLVSQWLWVSKWLTLQSYTTSEHGFTDGTCIHHYAITNTIR